MEVSKDKNRAINQRMRAIFILVFTLTLFISLDAQELSGKLQKAQCIWFRGSIYATGYKDGEKGLELVVEMYNEKLEKIKETTKPLGKYKIGDYYPPNFDTTHGQLSLTAQKTNNEKTAVLLRFNENLKPLAASDNAEITRINSFAAFDSEKIYYKNQLYVVREAKDTAGRFYFYRYDLRDSSALFNYNFKWQFNFDQHNYHRIHPVFVNSEHIYLFVMCLDGDKKGQWILIFNPEDGSLTKAIKLNKNDNEVCLVSRFEVYGGQEDIILAGVKYTAANVDLKTGRFSMNYQGSKNINTFFCQIDSSGEVKTRLENFCNAPNEILKEKEMKEFLFRCNALEKNESGINLTYECVYKGKDGIYRTFGFLLSWLNLNPEGFYKQENNTFLPCYRNDKSQPKGKTGNTNCKLTANQYDNDKAKDADRLFYKNAFVKNFTEVGMDMNILKKLAWVSSYYDNKKTATLELHKYTMKNYVWETASLKTITDYSRYNVFGLGQNKVIIFTSLKDESGFTLSLNEL